MLHVQIEFYSAIIKCGTEICKKKMDQVENYVKSTNPDSERQISTCSLSYAAVASNAYICALTREQIRVTILKVERDHKSDKTH